MEKTGLEGGSQVRPSAEALADGGRGEARQEGTYICPFLLILLLQVHQEVSLARLCTDQRRANGELSRSARTVIVAST